MVVMSGSVFCVFWCWFFFRFYGWLFFWVICWVWWSWWVLIVFWVVRRFGVWVDSGFCCCVLVWWLLGWFVESDWCYSLDSVLSGCCCVFCFWCCICCRSDVDGVSVLWFGCRLCVLCFCFWWLKLFGEDWWICCCGLDLVVFWRDGLCWRWSRVCFGDWCWGRWVFVVLFCWLGGFEFCLSLEFLVCLVCLLWLVFVIFRLWDNDFVCKFFWIRRDCVVCCCGGWVCCL